MATLAPASLPLVAVLGGDGLRAAFDFTTGALALVALTASVAWGLLATDRLLLRPRHRLVAQGVHRFTAIASLCFLLLHLTVKVVLGHTTLLAALVPFSGGSSATAVLVGFGSLAGLLMVSAATTGALRSAFAVPGRVLPGRWRALHMLAYPAWCSALLHGLFTGRPAAGWIVVLYGLCLAAVSAVLGLRLLPERIKRRIVAGALGPPPQRRSMPHLPRARSPRAALSQPRHARTPTGDHS
ncbi:hypothetical protein [Streptomyces cremeus]|uniref:Uncharacterized protein n=1 Tax=Streptomyces cremeus TaxID=66881 RepID=A0ABV5PD35_STRCM